MKKIFSLLLVLFPFSSESYTQWTQINFSNSSIIASVDNIDNNTVIAGALYDSVNSKYDAKAWYSINNGATWSESELPDSLRFLLNLQIINSTLIYGCGVKNQNQANQRTGVFIESINGGQTWSEKGILPDLIDNLRDIHFISGQTGFAVAGTGLMDSSGIIKTTDGGLTWAWCISPSIGVDLNKVSFYDLTNGFASGTKNQDDVIIFKTTDAGLSWTSVIIPGEFYPMDFRCISPDKIIYSTPHKIFLSQDSGSTWNEILNITPPSYFHGVNGLPGNLIVAYGMWGFLERIPFIYASFDNGQYWVLDTLSSIGEFLFTDSKIKSESEWYISGRLDPGGFLFKTTNSGGLPVELISFNVSVNGKNIMLGWKTATEKNNRGFEIERKLKNEDWQVIGFINGKGTSTIENSYSFTDDFSDKLYEGRILYRLKQYDFDGKTEYSEIINTDVNFFPGEITLYQNYPNPFNPVTQIAFAIPTASYVKLIIHNQLGQQVAVLADKHHSSGIYNVVWDAGLYSSGIYFYSLEVTDSQGQNTIQTKKLTVIK